MTAALSFSVLGVCQPFARVAVNSRGNAYDPAPCRHWKSQVEDAAREEMKRAGWNTATGAVRCDVTLVLVRRPTKTKRPARDWPIAGKSTFDLDNGTKPIWDALTRAGVFKDDKQIVSCVLEKRWQAPREEFAGAIVRVEVLG